MFVVRVDDGHAKEDNDVYPLDVNQFILNDGAGNNVYDTVGDLSLTLGSRLFTVVQ
jgi:hypothetical protein